MGTGLPAKCGHITTRKNVLEVELLCVVVGCKDCGYFNGEEHFQEDHNRAEEIIKELGLLGNK